MARTYLKIFVYIIEYHLLRFVARVRGWPVPPLPKFTKEQKKTLDRAFKFLLAQWKPLHRAHPHLNQARSFSSHFDSYKAVLDDLQHFAERKSKKESFDVPTMTAGANFQDYYKRNYHYQTDGYFSWASAHRYDHQIELLFLGTGHIIRKVAFSYLKTFIKGNEEILEFGAGTGTSAHQFTQLYPNIRIDLLDPSPAYLNYAKEMYPERFQDFIPEFIERFKPTKKYDCVFSCFTLHEIPLEQWGDMVNAIRLSLKPNGHLLILDSQQNCDKAENQFALDQFAEDFFEPYFQAFREKSLEEFFQSQGFQLIEKHEVLFSKALIFKVKP